MDDRILLVPPVWAPDPRIFESWAAPRVLLTKLEGILPVDILRWYTLKGEKRTGAGWEIAVSTSNKAPQDGHVIGERSRS